MSKYNGDTLIVAICDKLKEEKRLCTDVNILSRLRETSSLDIELILTFGKFVKTEKSTTDNILKHYNNYREQSKQSET